MRDLIASRHPAQRFDGAALDAQVSAHLAGVAPEDYGRWVYYPWSGRLVHLLPEAEFRELRAGRNRDKITREEQQLLRRSTIGVIGLSVGQASAVTLALEGVGGGGFRIADFDTLALPNLNRLRAGIHELGLNKAVLATRQMFEINPYLDIEIFPEGITERNLAGFLGAGAARLSVLVEDCDDLLIKVAAREQARLRRILVVMDVSDRGLVDIERFDLEPERPLFHGLATELPDELIDRLARAAIDIPAIHPNVAGIYRRKVERFAEAFQRPQERGEAAEAIRPSSSASRSRRVPSAARSPPRCTASHHPRMDSGHRPEEQNRHPRCRSVGVSGCGGHWPRPTFIGNSNLSQFRAPQETSLTS